MSSPTAPRRVPLATGKIVAEVAQGIGWLTFNNPERRNAMSQDMWQGLGDAAQAFDADPEVRVVVMRGAGGKAFVSGADISEFEKHRATEEQRAHAAAIAARGMQAPARLRKPVIAMVQGYCLGGGLALALQADVRFATPQSQFGIPAAKLGIGYGYGGVAALARLVGPSAAKDILFSARFLQADEALRMGLLNFVVADAQIEEEVRAYAQRIAGNAPLSVAAAKAAVQLFEHYADTDSATEIAMLVAQCQRSQDHQEGSRAFLEKRAPRFSGL